MATTPTKILTYDLDDDFKKLIDDLKRIQGAFPSLFDRLSNIGVDLMDKDAKKVVQDLITGYNDTSKLTIERIKGIEKRLDDLDYLLQIALAESVEGTEVFDYDPVYQNVTRHTVKDKQGALVFTIDYTYADLPSGKLNYSEKKFKDKNQKDVTVKKVYTYDANENIKNITSTITIAGEEVAS